MKDLHPLSLSTAIKIIPTRTQLLKQISLVLDLCIDCPKCVAECAFLNQYGTPKHIAAAYDPADNSCLSVAFECSLCGLCAAVCPVDLNPADMFLEMRRKAVDLGAASFPEHKTILAYEKRGTSKRYSWYSLPKNCHTVLFPGCTLTGTRPESTKALYEHLKTRHPEIGMVLDCCCKPSHDLGRQKFFEKMFNEMKSYLTTHGIKTIITACPNCYKIFKDYGGTLKVTTVYEVLLEFGIPATDPSIKMPTVSVHDPCVLRQEDSVHHAVRQLAKTQGFTILEMPHSKETPLCCGEGGSVGFISKKLSGTWMNLRKAEANDRCLLTYCAGCSGSLSKHTPTFHILDAIFNPKAVAKSTFRASKAPWTYLNRLRLKRYLKINHPAPVTREREFYET